METLRAFHNDEKIKNKYLARVQAHKLADEIVKGKYWEEGKGCAVGCTIHDSNHKSYETELGIPEWLAQVEDVIFEGLPNERSKEWPEQFLKAIKPGADLSTVETPFVVFILESEFANFDHQKYPDVKKTLDTVIDLYKKTGGLVRSKRESAAWSAAWSAAESAARSAARSAAESAAESAARSAAWSAAESAARSAAESAAWSAARSAAWSAAESAAWSAAWSAAESAAYEKFADKLLELLRDCQ